MNSSNEPAAKPGRHAILCLVCIALLVGSAILMAETTHAQPAPKVILLSAPAPAGQDNAQAQL